MRAVPCDLIFLQKERSFLERCLGVFFRNSVEYATIESKDGAFRRFQFVRGNQGVPFPLEWIPFNDDEMRNTLNTSRELQLGHLLIREIARLHDGSFMCSIDSTGKGIMSILTMPRPTRMLSVSPKVEVDIYGGRDSTLVELSEVLDKSFYHPDSV